VNQCVRVAYELPPPQKNSVAAAPEAAMPTVTSESATSPTQSLASPSEGSELESAQLAVASQHAAARLRSDQRQE
jgi:hypothetical protein